MGPISLTQVYITRHALDRFRIHHPEATLGDLGASMDFSEVIPVDVARFLAGRFGEAKRFQGGCYLLAPDRQGLFVLVEYEEASHFPFTCVTYLRFHTSQHEFALEKWPRAPRLNPFFLEPRPGVQVPAVHPDVGCALDAIELSPCLRSIYGGDNTARRILLEGDFISVSHDPVSHITTYYYAHRSGLGYALQRRPDATVVAGLLDEDQNAIDDILTA